MVNSQTVPYAPITTLVVDVGSAQPNATKGTAMPKVDVDGLSINYDVQGEGETVLLIPYTSADHACYAFQLPAYAEHFGCVAIDLPGSGESSTPPGPYSTQGYADQVALFIEAIGVERAHVVGMSLGAAIAFAPGGTPSRPGALAFVA